MLASATLEIADSPGPSLALTSINKANCGQANGAATVTATGGNGNLLFAWSHDAALIGPDATGLPVGSYSVTVTDENGCSTAINFNLDEEAAPTLTVVGTTPQDVTCLMEVPPLTDKVELHLLLMRGAITLRLTALQLIILLQVITL